MVVEVLLQRLFVPAVGLPYVGLSMTKGIVLWGLKGVYLVL